MILSCNAAYLFNAQITSQMINGPRFSTPPTAPPSPLNTHSQVALAGDADLGQTLQLKLDLGGGVPGGGVPH